MTREDYDRYTAAFNARDYDAVFDFYAGEPDLAFFGISIRTREELRAFYTFLHSYVRETITVEKFAASDELAAVEGVIRVEAFRDLTREALDAQGLQQFFPIAAGEVQEMRQYIHYHLEGGRIKSVGCAIVA
ncbi:MAG: nuclear transport factor 2 family protein [Erythrobacter sp.]|nr:MAG: nuclear transport factor 2 family protein [Erythrobacter sp.]